MPNSSGSGSSISAARRLVIGGMKDRSERIRAIKPEYRLTRGI
jgi:hypothetical protein